MQGLGLHRLAQVELIFGQLVEQLGHLGRVNLGFEQAQSFFQQAVGLQGPDRIQVDLGLAAQRAAAAQRVPGGQGQALGLLVSGDGFIELSVQAQHVAAQQVQTRVGIADRRRQAVQPAGQAAQPAHLQQGRAQGFHLAGGPIQVAGFQQVINALLGIAVLAKKGGGFAVQCPGMVRVLAQVGQQEIVEEVLVAVDLGFDAGDK